MKIVVVDCRGGGMGKAIIAKLKDEFPSVDILAVGTNAVATSNMLKGGAADGATGENAVLYNVSRLTEQDILIGPIGIMVANAMSGEVSPAIAHAVSASEAMTFLIPVSKCKVFVAGAKDMTLSEYVEDIIRQIKEVI